MTNPLENVIDWSRFSKHERMINVVVYCLRFRSKQRGIVTALERQKSELLILQMTQRESFAELFSKLEDNTGEKVKHHLAKLYHLLTVTTQYAWEVDWAEQQSVTTWNSHFYSQLNIPQRFWCWEKCTKITTMREQSTWEAWFNNDLGLLDYGMHCAASDPSVLDAESWQWNQFTLTWLINRKNEYRVTRIHSRVLE